MRKINLSFKKVLMTSVAALLGFATLSFAIPKGPNDSGASCDEPKPGPFAFNYAKDIGLTCPNDFYAYGEFLLMLANEEGLDYAITQNNNTGVLPLDNGNVHNLSSGSHDLDWSMGFRVGFGFFMGHDAWELAAKWTYLRPRDEASRGLVNTGVLIPLFLPAVVTVGTSNRNASMKWRAKHNILDLTIGKPYHVSRYFVFNPYAGIRTTWLDQDMTFRYAGVWSSNDGIKLQFKNDFWGIGIRGGAGGEYLLGAGWNLFANLSASLLYGKFDVSQNIPLYAATIELDQDFYTVVPNVELAFGISWANFFAKNKYRVALRVAYEFHNWWDQNRLWRFIGDGTTAGTATTATIAASMPVSHGNLSYNGFVFGLQFDF